ncbi:hypothetical protein IE979_24675 [Klebsiella pneumoniae]|uniref:Chromosome partition protein MukF C-terminal domain-containing protein n=1 Tax=Klebsiella pneumoniae TaxID=573 RepID=A0A927DTG7_KLEPN|nr:hypothetical protein [Klebsiella pneumoniae]
MKRKEYRWISAPVAREFLAQYPRGRHFDVARIVVDQAVQLGVARGRFHRTAGKMAAD